MSSRRRHRAPRTGSLQHVHLLMQIAVALHIEVTTDVLFVGRVGSAGSPARNERCLAAPLVLADVEIDAFE